LRQLPSHGHNVPDPEATTHSNEWATAVSIDKLKPKLEAPDQLFDSLWKTAGGGSAAVGLVHWPGFEPLSGN
jgi:hypothetical protein